MLGNFIRQGKVKEMQRHKGEGHVKMEAKIRILLPQAKEHHELPEARETRKGSP